jgi:hypothetical protein
MKKAPASTTGDLATTARAESQPSRGSRYGSIGRQWKEKNVMSDEPAKVTELGQAQANFDIGCHNRT